MAINLKQQELPGLELVEHLKKEIVYLKAKVTVLTVELADAKASGWNEEKARLLRQLSYFHSLAVNASNLDQVKKALEEMRHCSGEDNEKKRSLEKLGTQSCRKA